MIRRHFFALYIVLFLCLSGGLALGAEANRTPLYAGTATKNITIRAERSTDAEALGSYDQGDRVMILDYEPNWLLVQKGETIGYVLRHIIKVDRQLVSSVQRYGVYFPRHVASIAQDCAIFESPSLSATAVERLPKGCMVSILSLQDGWAKLLYGRQFAYVHASNLVSLKPLAKDPTTAKTGALIAAYFTPYSTAQTELNIGRMTNIEMACQYMQDRLLLPGRTFSYNGEIGPFSFGRGFKQAPILINGQTVPGSGGGTCQVATTLYNTLVTLPGIKFLTVRTHGTSGAAYVPHGMDAAVGTERIDLIFRNEYDFPIRMSTWAGNGIVYVALYKAEGQ